MRSENLKLVQEMLKGNIRSLSRVITLIEGEDPDAPAIIQHIYSNLGKAYRVGITGPPGAGKSTVVEKLTAEIRRHGKSVGVICVDPTSPFSGGALLGDRIRMQQHDIDNEIFIRSMATRGYHGGLSKAVSNVVKLMDAFGKDVVLIETVGVGQTELGIMENADAVIVVLVPEGGDMVQAMKAGIMEIGDIFVVNKADRPGANETVASVKSMLMLTDKPGWWEYPVIMTQAVNDVGIDELYRQIEKHQSVMQETGRLDVKRKEQRRLEFIQIMQEKIEGEIINAFKEDRNLSKYLLKIDEGKVEPNNAADDILDKKKFRSLFKSPLDKSSID